MAAYQNQQTRGFLWEEVSIVCFLDVDLWPAVYKVCFHVITESSCSTLSGVKLTCVVNRDHFMSQVIAY